MRYQVPRRCQGTSTDPRRPGTEIGMQSCEVARRCRVAGFATILSISLALGLPCSSLEEIPFFLAWRTWQPGSLYRKALRRLELLVCQVRKRIRRRPGNVARDAHARGTPARHVPCKRRHCFATQRFARTPLLGLRGRRRDGRGRDRVAPAVPAERGDVPWLDRELSARAHSPTHYTFVGCHLPRYLTTLSAGTRLSWRPQRRRARGSLVSAYPGWTSFTLRPSWPPMTIRPSYSR